MDSIALRRNFAILLDPPLQPPGGNMHSKYYRDNLMIFWSQSLYFLEWVWIGLVWVGALVPTYEQYTFVAKDSLR